MDKRDQQQAYPVSQIDLAGLIDHTLLKPDAVAQQYTRLCAEAVLYGFRTVCVNSAWVSYVAHLLKGTGIDVCAVVGFPLGAMHSRAKAFEARCAIEDGAAELDMVINVGQLKNGNREAVGLDIRAVRESSAGHALLKVIIETSLLTDEEKIAACEIAVAEGADFVKTSTGFSGGGATVDDIRLMRQVVGPNIGVKASGGIRTYDQAMLLIEAGANRLGCGASVEVISGGEAKGNY